MQDWKMMELPTKADLIKRRFSEEDTEAYGSEEFDDLRDLSGSIQKAFNNAWKVQLGT